MVAVFKVTLNSDIHSYSLSLSLSTLSYNVASLKCVLRGNAPAQLIAEWFLVTTSFIGQLGPIATGVINRLSVLGGAYLRS